MGPGKQWLESYKLQTARQEAKINVLKIELVIKLTKILVQDYILYIFKCDFIIYKMWF